MPAGVTQRRAHARRQPALHAGQPRLGIVVVRLIEILETKIVDIVATFGREAMHGKIIADRVNCPGQQACRLAG